MTQKPFPVGENSLSRRTLLKSGLCSLCALGTGSLASGQGWEGGRGGRDILPVAPKPDNPALSYDIQHCQYCGECRLVCRDIQTVKERPAVTGETDACVYCGQCVTYCREGALNERFDFPYAAKWLQKKDKTLIAAVAPSLPVSIGEMYRLPIGTDMTIPLVRALRTIGFDYVLDTSFAADLTIWEEAAELVRRIKGEAGPLPLFTSCCPAWVRFCELFFPERVKNLSTVKSPFLMLGSMIKTYFAEKMGLDPAQMVTVALAPCTAKKYEILLPFAQSAAAWQKRDTAPDIDLSLTTRETAYLLHALGEDLTQPEEAAPEAASEFDSFTGNASTGGVNFGATGGVVESLLRTAYFLLNEEDAPEDFLEPEKIEGIKGTRRFTADMKVRQLKAAIVHGLGNTRDLITVMNDGTEQLDVVEVMACRGGCLGGGGQPPVTISSRDELRKQRIAALRKRAAGKPVRLCHENPEINTLYADYLHEPDSEIARALLHRPYNLDIK